MTDYYYSNGKGTFLDAYPEIKSITVEVVESDIKPFSKERKDVYSEGNIRLDIPCHNSLCSKGGISIREVIDRMIQNRDELETLHEKCIGYEGSPKKGRSCQHIFDIKIEIEYK